MKRKSKVNAPRRRCRICGARRLVSNLIVDPDRRYYHRPPMICKGGCTTPDGNRSKTAQQLKRPSRSRKRPILISAFLILLIGFFSCRPLKITDQNAKPVLKGKKHFFAPGNAYRFHRPADTLINKH